MRHQHRNRHLFKHGPGGPAHDCLAKPRMAIGPHDQHPRFLLCDKGVQFISNTWQAAGQHSDICVHAVPNKHLAQSATRICTFIAVHWRVNHFNAR